MPSSNQQSTDSNDKKSDGSACSSGSECVSSMCTDYGDSCVKGQKCAIGIFGEGGVSCKKCVLGFAALDVWSNGLIHSHIDFLLKSIGHSRGRG